MNKYLKNPYVVVGLLGIAFYLYKRNQLLKRKPSAAKSVEELEETTNFSPPVVVEKKVDEDFEVPKALIRDVKKMDENKLKRTISTNIKMLKRARLSSEKKKKIKQMISYLKKEYARRTRKK